MKIPCPQHGAHFGDEIAGIMECPIVWARWGMQDLPVITKREILDWYLALPADKIFIETGYGIGVGLNCEYIGYENAFASNPEYEAMTEEQRREWQRNTIRSQYQRNKQGSKWTKLFHRNKR